MRAMLKKLLLAMPFALPASAANAGGINVAIDPLDPKAVAEKLVINVKCTGDLNVWISLYEPTPGGSGVYGLGFYTDENHSIYGHWFTVVAYTVDGGHFSITAPGETLPCSSSGTVT